MAAAERLRVKTNLGHFHLEYAENDLARAHFAGPLYIEIEEETLDKVIVPAGHSARTQSPPQ